MSMLLDLLPPGVGGSGPRTGVWSQNGSQNGHRSIKPLMSGRLMSGRLSQVQA